jgi:hypothetical protein
MYTINEDHTLNVHEGHIDAMWRHQSLFVADDGGRYYVSTMQGTMHYRKVWLVNRDDELATQLYINYHERKIKETERTLAMYKHALAVLKGENIHD